MSMEICRACGSFLMPGWERCRICGHEPGPSDAGGDGRAGADGDGDEAPPERDDDRRDRSARTVLAMLAVALAVAAVYLVLVQPSRETEPEPSAGGPTSTTSTLATTSTTTPTTSSTSAATATTPAPGGELREAFAAAMVEDAASAYPLDGGAWLCAGRLAVDAAGGPEAISEQGLEPADFASGQVGGRLEAPDGAVEEIATGLPGCGVVMIDLLAIQLASTTDPDAVECIEAELDARVADEALARQLLGDIDAMSPESPLFEAVVTAGTACGG